MNQATIFDCDFFKNSLTVLDYIPFGQDNAIKRDKLSALTGISDRAIRRILKHLVKTDGVIANYKTGGYYRSESIEEIDTAIQIETERLFGIQETIQDLEIYKEKLERR